MSKEAREAIELWQNVNAAVGVGNDVLGRVCLRTTPASNMQGLVFDTDVASHLLVNIDYHEPDGAHDEWVPCLVLITGNNSGRFAVCVMDADDTLAVYEEQEAQLGA